MRRNLVRCAPLVLVLAFFLAFSATARAALYQRVTTMSIPGATFTSSDITWLDASTRTYFLTDHDNKGIDLFDTASNTWRARIDLGNNRPSDVIADPQLQQVFVSARVANGPNGTVTGSAVIIADLKTNKVVTTIPTGTGPRGDEMGYDPVDHLIFQGNPGDTPPEVSVVSWDGSNGKFLQNIQFPDDASLEKNVWDPASGLIYLSIEKMPANAASGGVAVIDPKTLTVINKFPTPGCATRGIAIGPDSHVVLGCAKGTAVMDMKSGQVIAMINQVVNGDQVAYNPSDNHYYISGQDSSKANVLGIIDAATNQWIENDPTDPGADTKVVVDPTNSEAFVPIHSKSSVICPSGCVAVYGAAASGGAKVAQGTLPVRTVVAPGAPNTGVGPGPSRASQPAVAAASTSGNVTAAQAGVTAAPSLPNTGTGGLLSEPAASATSAVGLLLEGVAGVLLLSAVLWLRRKSVS